MFELAICRGKLRTLMLRINYEPSVNLKESFALPQAIRKESLQRDLCMYLLKASHAGYERLDPDLEVVLERQRTI